MNGRNAGEATIPAGASETAVIDMTNGYLIALTVRPGFSGSDLSFLGSDDGTDFYDIERTANPYIEPAGPKEWVVFGERFAGINYLRIRSGTLLNPTVQQYDAAFDLIGTVQTVEPNLLDMLPNDGTEAAPGFIGQWAGMLATAQSGTITANLALNPGETITAICFFVLSAVGPYGVNDTTPTTRSLGTPSISGAMVSQRFGNWQAIPNILYRVDIQVETSFGNSPEFYGYLPVHMLAG